jgi:ankyrin repeat protein
MDIIPELVLGFDQNDYQPDNHLWIIYWLVNENMFCDMLPIYQSVFAKCCWNGQTDIAKWLLIIRPDIPNKKICGKAFIKSCRNGHKETAEWLTTIIPEIDNYYSDALVAACGTNQIEIYYWLREKTEISSDDFKEILPVCCLDGHYDMVKLFWKLYFDNEDVNEYESVLSMACASGNLELVRFIYHKESQIYQNLFPKNIIYESLIEALNNQQYMVFEWLFDKYPDIDLHKNNSIFMYACGANNLDLVKKLWAHQTCILYDDMSYKIIKGISLSGNIDIAQWFLNIAGLNNEVFIGIAFTESCLSNQLELSKWLHESPYIIDLYQNNRRFFPRLVQIDYAINMELLTWLMEIAPNIKCINRSLLMHACKTNNIKLAEIIFDRDSNILDVKRLDYYVEISYLKGNLGILQLILSKLSSERQHMICNDIFTKCIHLNVLKWLWKHDPEINIYGNNYSIFKLSLNYPIIYEWLVSITRFSNCPVWYHRGNGSNISLKPTYPDHHNVVLYIINPPSPVDKYHLTVLDQCSVYSSDIPDKDALCQYIRSIKRKKSAYN